MIGAAGGSQGAASGATSALVGVANNFLKHDEAEKRAAAETGGDDDKTCQQEAADEINKWNAIYDAERDQAMAERVCPLVGRMLGWYSRLYEAQMGLCRRERRRTIPSWRKGVKLHNRPQRSRSASTTMPAITSQRGRSNPLLA